MIWLVAAAFATPQPIETGAATTDFPAVGTLYTYSSGAGGAQVCTATLLSSRAFLTAAHCAEQVADWQSGGFDVYFLTGPDVDNFALAERVDTIVAHPEWDLETLTADIGVGSLRRPIDEVEPMALGAVALSEDQLDAPLWLVGWGGTANDGSGAGTKRLGEVALNRLLERDYVVEERVEGNSACPGDSGAPIFRLHDGAEPDLIGVVSWGTLSGATHCGPYTGGPRLDAYESWVLEQVALLEPADTADSEPTVDTGLSEGSKDVACGCGTSPTQPSALLLALAWSLTRAGRRSRPARLR